MDLRPLSDDELLARTKTLAGDEHATLVNVIEHLMEVDRRDLAIDRGFDSLFSYCLKELGYSEAGSYYRSRAARAAREYPELIEGLRTGTLHLESIVRLSPHLTQENKDAVIERAKGAPRREVLKIAAELGAPAPPRRDTITPLPPPSPTTPGDSLPLTEVVPSVPRLRFAFDADDELVLMVDRLKELLRHKYPFATLEQVFKESARALIETLEKRKSAAVIRPAKQKPVNPTSRRIPAAVMRAVYERDGGRCTFVSEDARRCESRAGLEYDHITPWSCGGRSDDPANIRMMCRPHNQRLAKRRFGPRPKS